jgi:plastocyanin
MKAALMMVGLVATISLGGCDNEGPMPTPTPSSVPPRDMAAAPTPPPTAPVDMATVPTPPPPPPTTFPKTAAVTVGPGTSLTFAPQTVDIAAGGTVTWTWGGNLTHSVTSDRGVFDSGVKMTGTFSFTFPTAGTFGYFCVVHGRNVMFGSVVVH